MLDEKDKMQIGKNSVISWVGQYIWCSLLMNHGNSSAAWPHAARSLYPESILFSGMSYDTTMAVIMITGRKYWMIPKSLMEAFRIQEIHTQHFLFGVMRWRSRASQFNRQVLLQWTWYMDDNRIPCLQIRSLCDALLDTHLFELFYGRDVNLLQIRQLDLGEGGTQTRAILSSR